MGLITGRLDIPLSDKGIQWAKRVGLALTGVPFGTVYTSGLIRAVQTTLCILAANSHCGIPVLSGGDRPAAPPDLGTLAVQVLPDLHERGFGVLEGQPRSRHVDSIESPDCIIEQAETMASFIARVQNCFSHQIRPFLSKEKPTLVVGHGMGIRVIKGLLEGLPPQQSVKTKLAYGAVFSCQVDASPIIVRPLSL